jgi:hypothetical protein
LAVLTETYTYIRGAFRNKVQYAFFSARGGRRGFVSSTKNNGKAIWDDFQFYCPAWQQLC